MSSATFNKSLLWNFFEKRVGGKKNAVAARKSLSQVLTATLKPTTKHFLWQIIFEGGINRTSVAGATTGSAKL